MLADHETPDRPEVPSDPASDVWNLGILALGNDFLL